MSDKVLYLDWQGDLVVNQNGGLSWAYGWDAVRQRIVRRLLTNPKFKLQNGDLVPPEYIFDTDYGIGLGRLEGENRTREFFDNITQKVNAGVMVDEGVDVSKPPEIEFRKDQAHTLWIIIRVFLKDNTTGRIVFTLD